MTGQTYPAATMTPADTPTDPAEAYELVRGLIYDQVHKFRRRYGGEFDELLGQANLAFCLGHNQYITGQTATGLPYTAPFATDVRRCVWYQLFDIMRARLSRKAIAEETHIGDRDFAAPTREFNAKEWQEELSADARVAAALVLHPPEAVTAEAEAKGGTPRNYRSTVRTHLATVHGWRNNRINKAFDEIREALG